MAIDTPATIAVLGAGPIGLEAALYGRYLGYAVDIYERGRVGENLLRWGHAPLFTPFAACASPLGLAALKAQDPDWKPPLADAFLRGHELVTRYLAPLAQSDLLADGLRERTEVLAIGREGYLKEDLAGDESRGDGLFRILLRHGEGPHAEESVAQADVVIDTTGVYGVHRWLGEAGIPALGELASQPAIEYGVPDVLASRREHYAGRRVLVVGDTYEAALNIVALAELAAQASGTHVTWITRRAASEDRGPLAVLPQDPFPRRRQTVEHANHLARQHSHVRWAPGVSVHAVQRMADESFSVHLLGAESGEIAVDRLIANVGFQADHRLWDELQWEPSRLGAAGEDAAAPARSPLHTGEPNFYVLGAKSFGRDAGFVISQGFEQIREIYGVMGDRAELNLYATMGKLL